MKHTLFATAIAALAATVAFADVKPIVYEGHPALSEAKTLYAAFSADRTNETTKAAFKAFSEDSAKVTAYLDDALAYLDENSITTHAHEIMGSPEVYTFKAYVDGGYDAKFASRGQFCRNLFWLHKSPLCFTNWLNDAEGGVAMATNNPVYLGIMKAWASGGCKAVPTPNLLNYYAQLCSDPAHGNYQAFYSIHGVWNSTGHDKIVPGLVSKVVPEIKRYLRKSGKSFLTKDDGTNPVQDEVDVLQTALNTPKFAGLREWVAKIWPDYQWVEPTWKSDEEIDQLKEDVFYGQKDFNAQVKIILQSHLGTDAYNAFVEEYNQ